jgi:hypothetical protein
MTGFMVAKATLHARIDIQLALKSELVVKSTLQHVIISIQNHIVSAADAIGHDVNGNGRNM